MYRVGFKEWNPYSIKRGKFFEFYHTLWDIISPNKSCSILNGKNLIYGRSTLKKFRKNSKKHSYSDTIGGPFFKAHPVSLKTKTYLARHEAKDDSAT